MERHNHVDSRQDQPQAPLSNVGKQQATKSFETKIMESEEYKAYRSAEIKKRFQDAAAKTDELVKLNNGKGPLGEEEERKYFGEDGGWKSGEGK